jgi:hypothetical protein
MTRQHCRMMERRLRGDGVYKPYVTSDFEGRVHIESYPLNAIVTDGGCDPEEGPALNVKVTDCTLPRLGLDPVISTFRLFMGQDVCQHVGAALRGFHGPAHTRAVEQERALTSKLAADRQVGETEPEVAV